MSPQDDLYAIALPPLIPTMRETTSGTLLGPSGATREPLYYDLHLAPNRTLRRLLPYPDFQAQVNQHLQEKLAKLPQGVVIPWESFRTRLLKNINRHSHTYSTETTITDYLATCLEPIVGLFNLIVTQAPSKNPPIRWGESLVSDQAIPDAVLGPDTRHPALKFWTDEIRTITEGLGGAIWSACLLVEVKTPSSASNQVLSAIDGLVQSDDEYPWYHCQDPATCGTYAHVGLDDKYLETTARVCQDATVFEHAALQDSAPPSRPHNFVDKKDRLADGSRKARYIIQQCWAMAVKHDATFVLITTGNQAYFGVRHRKSQTLCLSPRFALTSPGVVPLFLGAFLMGYADACARAKILRETKDVQVLRNARIFKQITTKKTIENAQHCLSALSNGRPLRVGKSQYITIKIPKSGDWVQLTEMPNSSLKGLELTASTPSDLLSLVSAGSQIVGRKRPACGQPQGQAQDAPATKQRKTGNVSKTSCKAEKPKPKPKPKADRNRTTLQLTAAHFASTFNYSAEMKKGEKGITNLKVSCLVTNSDPIFIFGMLQDTKKYAELKEAGVSSLLPQYGVWQAPAFNWIALITDFAGLSLEEYGPWNLDPDQRLQFVAALKDIHDHGYLHGALTGRNLHIRFDGIGGSEAFILKFGNIRRLVDLDEHRRAAAKEAEMETLHSIMSEQLDPKNPTYAAMVLRRARAGLPKSAHPPAPVDTTPTSGDGEDDEDDEESADEDTGEYIEGVDEEVDDEESDGDGADSEDEDNDMSMDVDVEET